MRIIADEDVEYPIIERLRQDGHLVEAIAEIFSGALDLPVLATATQENVLLLTADLDFGGYIFRDLQPAPDGGIVLYRLDDRYSPEDKAAIVGAVFAARTADDFAHHFTVIEADHVRARPLP